jgi:hypothetical protein
LAEDRCTVTDPQLHEVGNVFGDPHRAACILV